MKLSSTRSVRGMLQQAGILTLGRALAALVSLVWFIIASRFLDVPAFGDLMLLLSVGAIMAVVTDGGFALLLNEAVSRAPESARQSLSLVLRRRLLLSLAATAGTMVLYASAADNRSLIVPAVFGISLLATAVYTSATAVLRGIGVVVPDAVNEVGSRLALLGLGWVMLANGRGLLAVVALYSVADTLSAAVLLGIAWRRVHGSAGADVEAFRGRRAATLALVAVVGLAYYRIDVWLLGLLSTSRQVAEYSVAVKLVDGLLIPAGAVAAVVTAGTAALGFEEARAKVDRIVMVLVSALSPVLLAIAAFGAPLLRVTFGASYAEALGPLRILLVSCLPATAGLAWSPMLALRSTGFLLLSVLLLAANVALNVVLIPRYGAEGAAVATLVCQAVYATAIRRRLAPRRATRNETTVPTKVTP